MKVAFIDGFRNVNAHFLNPVFMVVSTVDVSGICWFTHGRRSPRSDVGKEDSYHIGKDPEDALALDMQIWDGREVNDQGMIVLKNKLRARLPDHYDVIIENPGDYDNKYTLLHVEMDKEKLADKLAYS